MLRRSLQDLPPPAPPYSTEQSNLPLPSAADVTYNQPPPAPSSSEGSDVTPGILITVLVLAIAVILSASFYLLLRFLRRQRHRHHSSSSASVHHHHQQQQHHRPNSRQVSPVEKNTLIDALPLFPYESLNHSSAADCAVCLSKFEPKDLLRLLPICCHAFHAECIDTWLAANQSCPLCRSPILLSENELLGKFRQHSLSSSSISSSSRSFRVEIGNVSRRNPPVQSSGEIRRSYSIGDSFDYVVDDAVTEVPAGSFRMPPEFKAEPAPMMDDYGALAAEVGPRGGWLKDYLSYSLSSSSRTTSFRGSGRWFFTGSSRRSTAELPPPACHEPELDLEASQLSNEIGELFRWLSGV